MPWAGFERTTKMPTFTLKKNQKFTQKLQNTGQEEKGQQHRALCFFLSRAGGHHHHPPLSQRRLHIPAQGPGHPSLAQVLQPWQRDGERPSSRYSCAAAAPWAQQDLHTIYSTAPGPFFPLVPPRLQPAKISSCSCSSRLCPSSAAPPPATNSSSNYRAASRLEEKSPFKVLRGNERGGLKGGTKLSMHRADGWAPGWLAAGPGSVQAHSALLLPGARTLHSRKASRLARLLLLQARSGAAAAAGLETLLLLFTAMGRNSVGLV